MEPILVDIDGTIADFNGEFDRRYKKLYPDEIFIPSENRKTFHIESSYPKELADKIVDIFHEPGYFRSLQPIEGAIDALHMLDGKGYKIFLCTAPLTNAHGSMQEKVDWVKEHLGKRWIKKMIITDDKTLVRGSILIDDKPDIKGLVAPDWQQLYYDQPYNRSCGGERMIHWKFCEGILNTYMGIKNPLNLV